MVGVENQLYATDDIDHHVWTVANRLSGKERFSNGLPVFN